MATNGFTQLKVRLPENVIKQIQGVSKDPVDKIIRDAISHYLATYATEAVITNTVTQYISSTEELFEHNFDKLTNLMASLSYVSKFNNNILNAIFIKNGGEEDDLERLYNEATDTVQKYFYFEDNNADLLPIMVENDQLKNKVSELEKERGDKPRPAKKEKPRQLKPEEVDASVREAKEQAQQVERQKNRLEEQKKELVQWINGLILYVVQNYSHIRKNDKLLREYIDKNPKPKI
jgi:hypothetical protein